MGWKELISEAELQLGKTPWAKGLGVVSLTVIKIAPLLVAMVLILNGYLGAATVVGAGSAILGLVPK